MSKTYKDKRNYEFRHRNWQGDEVRIPYIANVTYWNGEVEERTKFFYLKQPTTKPKVKKLVDNEWHWLRAAPSWWVRDFMTAPKRASVRNWKRSLTLENIDDADCPDYGNKPHHYYW
jgi:hypothetical protein